MLDLIIGIVGTFFILIAFVLEEFVKKFNQNTVQYNFLNIIGAGLLTIYAIFLNSWPFIIINVVWAGVALIKLYRIIRSKPKRR